MIDELDPRSKDYFIIKTVAEALKSSPNTELKKKLENKERIYLDDNVDTLHEFVAIIDRLADNISDKAPIHLTKELEDINSDQIREILSKYRITTYGRSGMKLNSKKLTEI